VRAGAGARVLRVERLFLRAQAGRWGITPERFAAAIAASVAHGGDPHTLHLEDLALAVACADGVESAWEHFVLTHRPTLYRAADAIDRTGGAREAADALYAELFGLGEKDGVRQSLFRYYHGRSRLDTWLRAVLAQRHVDRLRAHRKLDPLPDDDGPHPLRARETAPDPERARFAGAMRHALATAIAALAPRDRLRLRLYYTQQMKLAAIGRMLGEHESTVSRHLTRTRGDIRALVDAALRQRHGFDARAVADCFAQIADDPGALDLGQLVGNDKVGKIGEHERSNE
jgi:RNA polymerase sigma-70 factor, ECF subfamily